LCLHDARRELTPAVNRLKDILMETLAVNLAGVLKTKPSARKGRFGKMPGIVVE